MNAKRGMTFAAALRSFLRQDPDVIMVGEIRDLETAEIAVKAAQTGHMVLSTLHTNDAPQTIARLMNMGAPVQHHFVGEPGHRPAPRPPPASTASARRTCPSTRCSPRVFTGGRDPCWIFTLSKRWAAAAPRAKGPHRHLRGHADDREIQSIILAGGNVQQMSESRAGRRHPRPAPSRVGRSGTA